MMSDLQETWGAALVPLLCPHCDRRFLMPDRSGDARCPHCFEEVLVKIEEEDVPYLDVALPERVVPFEVGQDAVTSAVEDFAGAIPFAPEDLEPVKLHSRIQRLYLPHWLVDRELAALWEAEVGFDYEVVSHQERYADGRGWQTREVTEDRIRWEPRVGRLRRRYENVPVSALKDTGILQRLEGYAFARARTYAPDDVRDGGGTVAIRLPDRSPEDAWPDAVPRFRSRAATECQRASQAEHIRGFRWSVNYGTPTWTLLLLPVLTAYYLDDDDQVHTVWINGQSGRIHGRRRASMKRAWRRAGIIAAVAAVVFVLSLILGGVGLMVPPLLALAAVGGVLALVVAMGAMIPVIRAWSFNRQQSP
jgi:DNA-directed RNA polymerase subunit RPC12/RpoP